MKKVKLNFLFSIVLLVSSCTSNKNIENSYSKSEKEIQYYKNISKKYNIDTEWWKGYGDKNLNNLVSLALVNNKDLIKASINVNKALYDAKLIGSDLIPKFSGTFESSASKKEGNSSSIAHSSDLMVSYEVDLWKKLSNAKDSKDWTYKATIEDLEAIRLSIINNTVNVYFSLMYINDSIITTKEMITYYENIKKIAENKYKYGTGDMLSVDETSRSILESKKNLIAYNIQKKQQEEVLKNILNLKPNEYVDLNFNNILTVKNIGIDLNVPISVIANRPDIKGYEYRLESSFKNVKASEKSLYPSVTLASSLTYRDRALNNVYNVPIGYGAVRINFPFLNWNQVKWNVKIDETSYETARENFEQSITRALNEVDTNYYVYTQMENQFNNINETLNYNIKISNYYETRYNNGVSEMKDWLNALAAKNSSKLNALNTKYKLIESEAKIYQVLAGKPQLIKN